MKKAISLLLALVMCLSLAACGGQEHNDNKPQTGGNTGNNDIDSTISLEENTQTDDSWEFLPYLYGEWKALYIRDEDVLESVDISEDGNIEIDGSKYKWKFRSESGNEAYFDILDGEELAGSISLNVTDEGDISLILFLNSYDNYFHLYKPAHYEIISINTENVYEYFELRDVWKEQRNAFDELVSVEIRTYLVLKEPYFSRLSEQIMDDSHDENVIANGAIELDWKRSGLDIVVNLEEKTYTFENFKSGTEDTETYVRSFSHSGDYAGFSTRRLYLVPDSEGRYTYTWACPYEMEILRLKLDLYLIAE